MTVAIALLLGATIVALAAPALLHGMAARTVDPVVVIVGWVLAMVAVSGTTAAALLIIIEPTRVADGPLARLVRRPWWSAVHGAADFTLYRAAGWAAAALLGVAVMRLLLVAVRESRARRARTRAQLEILRMVATAVPDRAGGPATLWLASDRALAFSLAGGPGTVVLTEGLRRQLPPAGVGAVLAHERAHLRGRHHVIVAFAGALATAFPFVRLFRAGSAALREQVELAADTEAVREAGPDALRAALLGVTGAGTPESALAMARESVDLRLRYLAAATVPPKRLGRLARCGSVGVLVAATPVLAAVLLLWAVSVLATAAAALS